MLKKLIAINVCGLYQQWVNRWQICVLIRNEIYSNSMQQQLELFWWHIPRLRFVTARSQTKTGCIKVAIGTLLYKMKPKTPNPSSISHPLLSPLLSYKHFWKSDKPSQKRDFPRVSINENPQMRPKCFPGFRRYICSCTACFYPTIQFATAVRPCLVSIFNTLNTRRLYLRKQDFLISKSQTWDLPRVMNELPLGCKGLIALIKPKLMVMV